MSRPVARMAHLGMGSFFRAHQAWYTAHAADSGDWGIAAFSGRSAALARALNAQGCRYTLIERHPDRDHAEIIDNIASASAGTDHDAWVATLSSPEVAVLTLTVTESAYPGRPEHDDVLAGDVRRMMASPIRGEPAPGMTSVPGRLLQGLRARRACGAGPLAVLPCDNLPGNGAILERAVCWAAQRVDPALAEWTADNVSFGSSVVDRITPATTDEDRTRAKELTGWADQCPVVTEPFAEWILAGDFPAGRPRWEDAGARFVDDVEVFERRKLWLLNGAHSLLAYAGAARGHETVAAAMDDDVCVRWMHEWWDTAQRHLPLDAAETAAYRDALTARFRNPRIQHRLAQIGVDGSRKLPARVLPVLRAELEMGREPVAAARILAAWIRHLRGETFGIRDPAAAELTTAARGTNARSVRAVLSLVDRQLGERDELVPLTASLINDR